MTYRLDTNKYGRSINALVTLEELRDLATAQGQTDTFEIRGDEIHDSDGVVATFPKYCRQNDGDRQTCELAVYGRDCASNWVMWEIVV